MQNDIVILREGTTCRILFGYLRLTSMLSQVSEVDVVIRGEGNAKIIKTGDGLIVYFQEQVFPLQYC